jgi:hypothetical protein
MYHGKERQVIAVRCKLTGKTKQVAGCRLQWEQGEGKE